MFFTTSNKKKIGIAEAQSIFGENENTKQETIRIVLLPVGELPVSMTIPKNDYDMYSKLVGGPTSSLVPDYAHRDIIMVINDVGKLQKLTPNRYLFDGKDVLCGQAFLIANNQKTHQTESMTDEQVAYCKEAYAKFIDNATTEVLDPIIEKHAGITLESISEIGLDDDEKVSHCAIPSS